MVLNPKKQTFLFLVQFQRFFFSLESLWNFQQRILARTCSFSNLLRAKVVLFSTNEISVSSKLLCQTYYCVHFRSVSTLVDHCGHIMVHSAKLFILVCRSWIQKCFIQLNWNFKIRLVMSGYLFFFQFCDVSRVMGLWFLKKCHISWMSYSNSKMLHLINPKILKRKDSCMGWYSFLTESFIPKYRNFALKVG